MLVVGQKPPYAQRHGEVEVIADTSADKFTYIPSELTVDEDADYLHICSNNTIYGTAFPTFPSTLV